MKLSVLCSAAAIGAAFACAGEDSAPDAGTQPQPDATIRQDGAGVDSTIIETRDEEVLAETEQGSFANLVVHDDTMFWYGRQTEDDTSMAIVARPIACG